MRNLDRSSYCHDCLDCRLIHSVFKALPKEVLADVNKQRFEVRYNARETIMKQGAAATQVMTLTSGLAKLYHEGVDGKKLIIRLLKPGDMFGSPALYTDNRHAYTVSALEDCAACFLDASVFRKLIITQPLFAERYIRLINQELTRAYRIMNNLTHKQMPGRVADALLYLHNEIYQENPFHLVLSRQDLADLCSLSKESVVRILKEFKDEGLIRVANSDIEILDYEALNRISEIG